MANTKMVLSNLLSEGLPIVENWLRAVVADEVRRTIETERQKSKPEKMLTRHEVCEILNVSLPTLWGLTKRKKITPIHVGRRVLFPESEIKRFMEG